jgi:hypothetical protein
MILPSTYKSPADFIEYRESRINTWWLDCNVRIPAASTMTSDSKRDRACGDSWPPIPRLRTSIIRPQQRFRSTSSSRCGKSHDLDLSILRQPPAVEGEPIAATLVFRCRLGMRIFGALQMNFASVV